MWHVKHSHSFYVLAIGPRNVTSFFYFVLRRSFFLNYMVLYAICFTKTKVGLKSLDFQPLDLFADAISAKLRIEVSAAKKLLARWLPGAVDRRGW